MKSRLLFFLTLLLLPTTAWALNVELFRPNFDGLGLINALDSRSLDKHDWSLGMHLSYAHHPLELGIVGTGTRVDSVVDYHINMTLNGAYGLTDWVTLGIFVPFFPNLKLEPVGSSVGESTAAFGDLGLAAKFRIWNWGEKSNDVSMGFAVAPFLTFPSGSDSRYVGDTNVTGGLRGIYDVTFWKNKWVTNLGVRFREEESAFNLTVGQEMLYSLGYTRPIWEWADLHIVTELNGSTTFNGFATRGNRSPLEGLAGFRKGFLKSHVQTTVGAAMGLTTGYGAPDYRVFGMLTYQAPPKKTAKKEPEKKAENGLARVEEGRIVILQPIYFETGKSRIVENSVPVIQAVADVMATRPHILLVRIEGHTDARGDEKYNDRLSEHRAEAVLKKLVELGIAPDRLTSQGWGEHQPIADNETDVGMAQNRRVEFHIVEVKTR